MLCSQNKPIVAMKISKLCIFDGKLNLIYKVDALSLRAYLYSLRQNFMTPTHQKYWRRVVTTTCFVRLLTSFEFASFTLMFIASLRVSSVIFSNFSWGLLSALAFSALIAFHLRGDLLLTAMAFVFFLLIKRPSSLELVLLQTPDRGQHLCSIYIHRYELSPFHFFPKVQYVRHDKIVRSPQQ